MPRTLTPLDLALSRALTPETPPRRATGTPPPNAGTLAVESWLRDRGIYSPSHPRWRVEITLEVTRCPASYLGAPPKFRLTIHPSTWGFVFVHGERTSAIDVANIALVRDRDDHRLLAMTPALKRIGSLLRDLEERYHVFFPRHDAVISSDLPGSEPMIRAWVSAL